VPRACGRGELGSFWRARRVGALGALGALGADRALLVEHDTEDESAPSCDLPGLCASLVNLTAIVDENRRTSRSE
jgi:hypothetical protein